LGTHIELEENFRYLNIIDFKNFSLTFHEDC